MAMFLGSSFGKAGLQARLSQKSVAQRRVHARAEKKEKEEAFVPPPIPANIPSPYFTGSTEGLGNMARTEEFYVIMWESKKEQLFDMPGGLFAKMREGKNMMKFSRKEQCLCLTTHLRQEFKLKPMFWRVYPNGEVQYLHPADGQYPEKVTAGRALANVKDRKIGVDPREAEAMGLEPLNISQSKFPGKEIFDM